MHMLCDGLSLSGGLFLRHRLYSQMHFVMYWVRTRKVIIWFVGSVYGAHNKIVRAYYRARNMSEPVRELITSIILFFYR